MFLVVLYVSEDIQVVLYVSEDIQVVLYVSEDIQVVLYVSEDIQVVLYVSEDIQVLYVSEDIQVVLYVSEDIQVVFCHQLEDGTTWEAKGDFSPADVFKQVFYVFLIYFLFNHLQLSSSISFSYVYHLFDIIILTCLNPYL